MARALRIEYPGAFYHVTCRGNEQKPIFRDDHDRTIFLNRLQISINDYQVILHTYVLMNNHFHFVVETPIGNLSEFMRHFNVAYTGYFNRQHLRVGHLYQGRFKAIVVEADSYLVELSRYVHLNPIRVMSFRGRTVKEKLRYLMGYRWSSLGGYVREADRQGFVHYARVLEYVGGDNERGRGAYARLAEEGVRRGMVSPWEGVQGQVLLGSEGFAKKIRGYLAGDSDKAREQPAVRALSKRWEAAEVIERVAKVLGKGVKELCARGGGIERAIVMECLHRYAQESQAEIGRRMGSVDYTWVSRMRGELRRVMQGSEGVRKLFEKVEAAILTHE